MGAHPLFNSMYCFPCTYFPADFFHWCSKNPYDDEDWVFGSDVAVKIPFSRADSKYINTQGSWFLLWRAQCDCIQKKNHHTPPFSEPLIPPNASPAPNPQSAVPPIVPSSLPFDGGHGGTSRPSARPLPRFDGLIINFFGNTWEWFGMSGEQKFNGLSVIFPQTNENIKGEYEDSPFFLR